MADVQIVYREPYCDDWRCHEEFCMQCYTDACARDLGCDGYKSPKPYTDEHGNRVLPLSVCENAKYRYVYMGWTGKKYEMAEERDNMTPELDCMDVWLGSRNYKCVKVILNGKCIFNEFDAEEVKQDGQS